MVRKPVFMARAIRCLAPALVIAGVVLSGGWVRAAVWQPGIYAEDQLYRLAQDASSSQAWSNAAMFLKSSRSER